MAIADHFLEQIPAAPVALKSAGRCPLIKLSGVGKTHRGGALALADVDLTVGEGEFVSILGPSGCGKSTSLRLVAGLGRISSGTIDWPQSRYDASGEPIRDLGFVFQEMPWATVFANIYLPLKLAGVSRAAAKPRILLLDEPFAALDEITRFRLNNDLLRVWQAQRWTVLFVTHSVFEAVYLSNRIIVMSARPGRIVADLPITAPYPRGEAFRTSTAYNEFCRITPGALGRTMTNLSEEEH